MSDYGERIKAAREAFNLTQEQLGGELGVTGVTIMRYEKNQRRPSLEQLVSLCKALGVSLSYFLDDSETDSILRGKEEYRKATSRAGASKAFKMVLEAAYGNATERRKRGDFEDGLFREERFWVYENAGAPFALLEDDVDTIFEASYSVMSALVGRFAVSEQEARERIESIIKELDETLHKERKKDPEGNDQGGGENA